MVSTVVAAIVHEYGEELCGVIVTDDIVRNYGGFVGLVLVLVLDLVMVMAMAMAMAMVVAMAIAVALALALALILRDSPHSQATIKHRKSQPQSKL